MSLSHEKAGLRSYISMLYRHSMIMLYKHSLIMLYKVEQTEFSMLFWSLSSLYQNEPHLLCSTAVLIMLYGSPIMLYGSLIMLYGSLSMLYFPIIRVKYTQTSVLTMP